MQSIRNISPIRSCFLAALAAALLSAQPASAEEPRIDYLKYDAQAKALVAQMTLDEKIGQMTQPEATHLKDLSEISQLCVGSVLCGGNGDPADGNSPEAWSALYERCQQETAKTRLKIPLLFGIDAVHGHNNVIGAVIFPHNIGLGCAADADLVERVARITAEEVRATGINWAFAPCVTVPQDIRWGRTYEGFSENADLTTKLGLAAVRGLQGNDLANPHAVLGCAKHFVGDGGTAYGTGGITHILDQGDTRVNEAMLRNIHLKPYKDAIDAGVGTIMPSYSSWNGTKCSASKCLLTAVLKGELGFQGFLISDYNAIDQITDSYKDAIAISINAGMDMVMVPENYAAFYRDLKQLVEDGDVPIARIDDAVTRILRVKLAMGLMSESPLPPTDPQIRQSLGSDEHRAVAREAVRKSLVLLKNERNTLPLAKSLKHIHVAGVVADDIGRQCGGWTINWQGGTGNTVPGTTILAAIRAAVSPSTKVTFSADGTGGEDADAVVLVVGETPYAEGDGDTRTLTLPPECAQAAENVKALKKPTVLLVVSGRPVIINDLLDQSDACLAAWLPGSEGQGVADVLFGDYHPTAHLSFTWPKSIDQLPLHKSSDSKPLFDYGYGLSYGE